MININFIFNKIIQINSTTKKFDNTTTKKDEK